MYVWHYLVVLASQNIAVDSGTVSTVPETVWLQDTANLVWLRCAMQRSVSIGNPKLLRWAFKEGLPPLSPFTSDSEEWGSSSSSLAFLSSQLVAHGFARPPGLAQPLHKLDPDELEPVLKCLRDLLAQRIVRLFPVATGACHLANLGEYDS